MRVRIVSYEDINAWILGKFARRLREELLNLGVEADIGSEPDPKADINHHIIYLGYDEAKATAVDTLMITHIDDIRKLNLLTSQLKVAKAGICMSAPIMNELASAGLPADRILYISPAHDGVIKPRKIVIGITSKVQPDGCKREYLVEQLFDHISPDVFSLSIMGAGWDSIVDRIRRKGFEVVYHDEFEYDTYTKLVPTFDYYLYTGQDEGSMGFIDALAAGVKTVVTPQGYHLDAPGGIVHAFNEIEELRAIFDRIQAEKQALLDAVKTWNWRDHAIKHMEVWEYLLTGKKAQSQYADGLNSMLGEKQLLTADELRRRKNKMRTGMVRRMLFKLKKLRDREFMKRKISELFTGKK
ncbi:hypothetical protein [Paraflavitalea sp. CAU 1676]|uniref:hypothetical protein n=1 Tax=Paraflavitalea sp. CAU 1676 TaxID=3032598 RepID=UPI0023DCD5AB|nr:hypothetical protein [Paraflavitalea sp. CAU 1676]MDF2187457.1 hypothetical protein [Paraflavitalea sp. CAU 1676]